MPSETVQLDWISDQDFLLRDRSGFPVIMTQPRGVNGADLLPARHQVERNEILFHPRHTETGG